MDPGLGRGDDGECHSVPSATVTIAITWPCPPFALSEVEVRAASAA